MWSEAAQEGALMELLSGPPGEGRKLCEPVFRDAPAAALAHNGTCSFKRSPASSEITRVAATGRRENVIGSNIVEEGAKVAPPTRSRRTPEKSKLT